MVYTEPMLIKLSKPITLKIDTICKTLPAEQ